MSVFVFLIAGLVLADDSLFVNDSMFVYYSELGDLLLNEYCSNPEILSRHTECLEAYLDAINAVEQSIDRDPIRLAKAHFQFANAIIITDTIYYKKPFVGNWRSAKSHFDEGKFLFQLRLNVIASSTYDKEKYARIVDDFDKYFKAYIWLLEAGGDSDRARKIKQDFERCRLLFK